MRDNCVAVVPEPQLNDGDPPGVELRVHQIDGLRKAGLPENPPNGPEASEGSQYTSRPAGNG